MVATANTPSLRAKEFHFPVSTSWTGGRRVEACVHGKEPIEVTPPPEFRGTDPTTWSPEDLFVAAAASCLAVTFTGLAERGGLGYSALKVDGDGIAGRRADGQFGFTHLFLRLEVETEAADAPRARELARRAEATCLVSASLDLPVQTEIEILCLPRPSGLPAAA